VTNNTAEKCVAPFDGDVYLENKESQDMCYMTFSTFRFILYHAIWFYTRCNLWNYFLLTLFFTQEQLYFSGTLRLLPLYLWLSCAGFSLISTVKFTRVGVVHAVYIHVSVSLKQMPNKLTKLREISKFIALELTQLQ
jgi:hypothetical protein